MVDTCKLEPTLKVDSNLLSLVVFRWEEVSREISKLRFILVLHSGVLETPECYIGTSLEAAKLISNIHDTSF